MAKTLTRDAPHPAFSHLAACGLTPAGVEQYKLERLLELRAVITSKRLGHGQDLVADALAKAGSDRRS